MNASEPLSAGLKALPTKSGSFASTQAAWRFYRNETVSLSTLQAPLTAAAHTGIRERCATYALCLHDWSRLHYRHANKSDTYAMTHKTDVGYDLQTSLVVSDRDGQPLAPVAQRLVSNEGSYATYQSTHPVPAKHHLDEVTDSIRHLEQQGFAKPLVHVIDREGDSVGHIRAWETAACRWLVRAKDNPKVAYHGQSMGCKAVAADLEFTQTRPVSYQGKVYWQWVAEADVHLTRPAKPSQKKSKKPPVPGLPVPARLVVSRIMSDTGEVLAEWLLLTNVAEVEAATIALWYYWRWKIESFFKLLKSAGHQLEAWQQESALAIAKRLLVASMACVMVWEIAAAESPHAEPFRALLVKLSGRQMKRGVAFTHPALLAGLWVYLSLLEMMETYTPEQLHLFRETARGFGL
jgi:IS4 transposase